MQQVPIQFKFLGKQRVRTLGYSLCERDDT